jgi:Zn-dependent protease
MWGSAQRVSGNCEGDGSWRTRYNMSMEPAPRDYEPVQPRGTDWRGGLRKLLAPIVFVGGLLLKLGSLAKFGAIFLAFGGYTLIWGWQFALGVIFLLFTHEMGHFIEARREGLNPSWPVFIPFLGAYVQHTRGNPWQTARVAIAGPILGGIAALACYLVGESQGSNVLIALGYAGFVLNLVNLLPFWILDGASVWRSTRFLWYGGGRDKAIVSGALYVGTAFLLAVGAWVAYLPQHRL